MAGRSVPTVAVPAGLEPVNHFKTELHACSPLDMVAPTPHDVEVSVRIMVEQKGNIKVWRRTHIGRTNRENYVPN